MSETLGDLLRESLAVVGFAGLLFYYDAGLALVCLTGRAAGRVPARAARAAAPPDTTRRSQEHLEHMSHVATEAFTGHRIVKAFGAEDREAERFGLAARALYRANLKVTATRVGHAADHGAARRRGHGVGRSGTAAGRSRAGRLTEGEFTAVRRGAVPDVRARSRS